MFEPRKLRPFSIEYCSAPIAVMTEMTEKTPMVIPNIVRPERNLFTPNEPSAIVIVSLNCIFRNSNIEYRISKSETNSKLEIPIHSSDLRMIAPKIFSKLKRFPQQAALLRLLFSVDVHQAKPIPAFFGFPPANLNFHHEVLFPDCFVCFDVIGTDRARSANELLYIFDV